MRREWESWSFYRGIPRSPEGGRQAPPVARGGGGRQAPLPRPWAGPSGRPRGGDRPPCRPLGGDRAFFFQRPHCEFEEKKLHLRSVALWGATVGIFEIFQNGYIFFKFLFFKNIKKKKAPWPPPSGRAYSPGLRILPGPCKLVVFYSKKM